MGGGRPRLLAVIDSPRCAEFLAEIAGVYRTDRFGKILALIVLTVSTGLTVWISFTRDTGAIVFLTVFTAMAVFMTLDGWSTTVLISPEGVSRTSLIRFLNFSAPAAAIRRISVMEKGSLFLSIDFDDSKKRTAAIPTADRALVFRAARVAEDPHRSQTANTLVAASVAGAGIGFAGAIVAGPLYSEMSETLGTVVACVIIAVAIIAGRYVARPLRLGGGILAALFCALILLTLLTEFAR